MFGIDSPLRKCKGYVMRLMTLPVDITLDAVAVSEQNLGWSCAPAWSPKIAADISQNTGELKDWFKAINTVRGTDPVIMTGTGMEIHF
jgi:hypothetical protein